MTKREAEKRVVRAAVRYANSFNAILNSNGPSISLQAHVNAAANLRKAVAALRGKK